MIYGPNLTLTQLAWVIASDVINLLCSRFVFPFTRFARALPAVKFVRYKTQFVRYLYANGTR